MGNRRRGRTALDSFTQLASGLTDLAVRHAVSGHEWSVRRAVLESLPAWARERAVVDDIGNIMIEAGPAAPARNPGVMQAWFGLDAAGLAARGVAVGMQVTSYKAGLRLGRTRYTARSLDDRAGTIALVRAINQIDPERLPGKLIFAWSVHEEEGGWRGATAMARRLGRTTTRIYSIDTFVSSDTPLESPHFAYAPLGKGPVLRAIESSCVSPDEERSRVQRAATAARIPLQFGLTQGGTDGSAFTFWGAPNQALSWPGRYSHSPGEVLDLRDLDMLARLIVAVASASER